ncbi:berberine bridge enzyme-like 8 [Mercurialis annua]|uniref:berberine bridge enzyme-like 8 n=1 Tax=Mercurialis annua TaxID=3986 RepID=UPI00215EFA70|nr:berberine bridge enzyme-like 8 [Mercurialis annua]
MTISRSLIVSLLLPIFLLFISCTTTSTFSSPNDGNIVECLLNYSEPSHPISNAIFTPNNVSFSSVLETYIRNLRFNMSSTPKPLFIVTALHASHVQASVVCARIHGLQMKIRSGGHDYEGTSYISDVPFFVLDMFNLRKIDVDIESETAWVQSGATLGEVYYRISEKSNVHGFPAGVCPTVGVGGHLSGGGYGNMMRKYGLTADNIVDAEIVDVDGRLLDRKSMGEDLFWAIRGGGGASFGVVISYKIKLVRVPKSVTVFRVDRNLEQNATDIVNKWQRIAYNIDDNLFIRLTLNVSNGTGSNIKTIGATFRALFLGDSSKLVSLMNETFPELGLIPSDCIEMSWVESVLFWTDFPDGTPTTALLSRTPQSLTYLKRKSDYVKKIIPRDELEKIWQKMIELQFPAITFNPYGGKMAEIPSTEIPFPHRAGNLWKIQYATNWNEDGTEAENRYINLTRQLYNFMTPYVSKNPRESFLNYRDLDLGINHNEGKNKSYQEGRVYGIKYFKENFDRLVDVKTKADPENFFRNEQSIPVFPYPNKQQGFLDSM